MKDRILKLEENVTDQQKKDINSASFISLCIDESIDITKPAHLAVFARYWVENVIKEELIAITSLLTTTQCTDICTAVRNSLAEKDIDLKKIVSVITDGAPNMTHLTAEEALAYAILTIFSSTYACESLFSDINNIKDSFRNRLADDSNSACILLKVTSDNSDISDLSSNLQQQKSH
ncbi:uncharacterized protein TNCV_3729081 [Trichonephila clavipes]|nr:uncharacterized protein TNCV_3729081 [Trichonephila clavipes]